MAKTFYTSTLLFMLLLGSQAYYTPGGDYCTNGDTFSQFKKPPTLWTESSHANIIKRYSTSASTDYACHDFCESKISSAPSGTALTLLYRTGSSCYCYFNKPVNGVEHTTDGVIPLVSTSGSDRTLIVCPQPKYFEDNARCHGESFSGVPSIYSCQYKCYETEGCKAYSYREDTDQCIACPSSDRTDSTSGSNHLYDTKRVTVTPVCDGLPGGNGANGNWKWTTTNWSYSDFLKGIYQDEIRLQCDSGYTLGGSGLSKFECSWDGSWVPLVNAQGLTMDTVTCEPKECALELGLGVTTDCGDAFSYLDFCTASCSEGYVPNTATLSCVLDGGNVVVEGSLECEATTCPVTLEPGVESECGANLDVYQSCAVSCAPYYMETTAFYHSDVAHCDEEADFILSVAQCEEAAMALGLTDVTVSTTNNIIRPYGCYFKDTSDTTKLWLNTNPESDLWNDNDERTSLCLLHEPNELSCNWENGAPALGQSMECVCQEPLMDFASPTLISNAESAVLENGQINIHVRFPPYLNDVLLKFDSINGEVAYDETDEAASEGWTLSAEPCSQVLERQLAFSELQDAAAVTVDGSELTFSLYFSSTETFPHPAEGFPVTRTVVKTLTFTLELATSIELTLDIGLHSQIESIVAVEFNYFWADLAGFTNEEIIASIEADLEAQGINVQVLSVQSEEVLGGFRRALAASSQPHVVIAFGGSQEEMDALLDALENQSFGFDILDDAVMLTSTDYTQLVSVTSEYSDVVNADGSSTATIHFATAINEPWEFTGVYTMEDFTGTAHALEEVSGENSCKQEGEMICEQQWTLTIEISAEDVCATAQHAFTVNMQAAHGEEVVDDAHVGFDFSVLPNQDQCQQITDLGEASNVEGAVQVWNSAAEVFEEDPSFDIFLGDVLTFQASVTSQLGDISSITLSNVKATQVENEEVCADCLTEFPDEFAFSCSTCDDSPTTVQAVNGHQMNFTMRMSGDVFTGYTGESGKPTQLTFTFDLQYVQGAQRRLLAVFDSTGSRRRSLAAANGAENHVQSVEFGLHATSAQESGEELLTQNRMVHLLVVLVVCLLLLNIVVVFPQKCCQHQQTTEEDYKPVEILL